MAQRAADAAESVVAEAKKVLADIGRQLEEAERELRRLGVDPAALPAFAAGLDGDGQRQLAELLRADMESVEDQVKRSVPQSEPEPPTARTRRPRTMV